MEISRRKFLKLAGAGTAATFLAAAGCAANENGDADNTALGDGEQEAQGASEQTRQQEDTYAKTPQGRFAAKIHELETDQTLTLLWISDLHYKAGSGERSHPKVVEYLDQVYEVAKALQPAALVASGDLVDGSDDLAVHQEAVSTMVAAFQKSPVPVLAVRGNHDDNSYWTENVTTNNIRSEVVDTLWLAEHLIAPCLDDACVQNPHQGEGCTYYYRDFEAPKVRAVVLDDIDVPYAVTDDEGHLQYRSLMEFGIGATQMGWLAEEALQFDEPGWAVLLICHVNLDDSRPYGLRAWGDVPVVHNDGKVLELLQAFVHNQTGILASDDGDFAFELAYDFSANPSNEVLCCLNGHTHRDQCHFQDGLLSATVRGFNEGSPARINGVVIDRATGMLHVRAYDKVLGDSVDWDLNMNTGEGIPERFNYYWPGTYVTNDGTQAG